jgi:hypothetical protein
LTDSRALTDNRALTAEKRPKWAAQTIWRENRQRRLRMATKGVNALCRKGRRRARGAVEVKKSAVEAVGSLLAWGRVLQGSGRSTLDKRASLTLSSSKSMNGNYKLVYILKLLILAPSFSKLRAQR